MNVFHRRRSYGKFDGDFYDGALASYQYMPLESWAYGEVEYRNKGFAKHLGNKGHYWNNQPLYCEAYTQNEEWLDEIEYCRKVRVKWLMENESRRK